jgi:hypothetical protein
MDRLRLDHPQTDDDGKVKHKYVTTIGAHRIPYFVCGTSDLLADLSVQIVFVEAEKSALSGTAWAQRTGRRMIFIALGGCYGWRKKTGEPRSDGSLGKKSAPLDDLNVVRGHQVFILFDSNATTNPDVRTARQRFARHLRKEGPADVCMLDLPQGEGVNGPDDLVAVLGDDALAAVFDTPAAEEWRRGLIRSERGKILACSANIAIALRESPDWAGVLAYNEFSHRIVARTPPPWAEDGEAVGEWSDRHDTATMVWLNGHGIMTNSLATVAAVVNEVAYQDLFHPIRAYFRGLRWDGVKRLDTWLVEYAGAEDTSLTRAIGARFLIAGCARIEKPGAKADNVLVLDNNQDTLKSTLLRTICPREQDFADHISDLGTKDSRQDLLGKMIIEMSELSAARRGEVERIKGFITTQVDHFRASYGRRSEDYPRQCIFAATTNDATPFLDATGNRRFWPVHTGTVNIGALARDKDQLWAEAFTRYQEGERWWLGHRRAQPHGRRGAGKAAGA